MMQEKDRFRTKNEQKAVGLLDICVVIPVQNSEKYLLAIFHGVDNQSLLPREIVIVDSSSNNIISNLINEWNGAIPVKYIKVDTAYPGDARNVGVEIAKSEWIAFLDSTTVPEHDWLERCVEMAIEKKADFVGGLALFEADTYFKKLLRATTYGCSPYGTLPGSIIKKEIFEKSGGFIPSIRSSEDIEWIERIKTLGVKTDTVKYPVTKYYGLPGNLWSAIKKYYKFAMATAQTEVLKGQKKLYMSALLILLTILTYKWNLFVAGWDKNSILFIPHITKIYLVSLVVLYVVFKGFLRPWNRKIKLGVFEKVYLLVIAVLITGLIYNWNMVFARFNVESIFYIPHITKIYVTSLLLLSIVFRGIIRPLRRNIEWSFIFPFKWILIGLIGVTLDVVKAPGYLWGGMLGIMGKTIIKTT
jgi:glycosyltransferase involved in cell wall biosynthesis